MEGVYESTFYNLQQGSEGLDVLHLTQLAQVHKPSGNTEANMKLCGCSKFKETLKHKINSNNITRKKEGQHYCLNTSEAHWQILQC